MNLTLRYLADLGERTARTFVQAYLGYWLTLGAAEYDTLFTIENLKVAVAAAVLSVATAILGKGIGNPASASVLPPAAQPPAPASAEPVTEPPAPAVPASSSGLTDNEQLAALLRQIQIAAPPAPAPPPPTLAPPPTGRPLGLLDPMQVGGRDPNSEGNT